ncbi:hypothetical protein EJ08DRAFT_52963 [Tothia fuscella]|uniref:Uncharacterized protein n=1 Tax=Tothia fuscella TaxID=1048955 RepID=A0A9P4NFC6_9PEZI|nr:hypothetical protein EJ08DRAFT_52963 [Tothia fuscella]
MEAFVQQRAARNRDWTVPWPCGPVCTVIHLLVSCFRIVILTSRSQSYPERPSTNPHNSSDFFASQPHWNPQGIAMWSDNVPVGGEQRENNINMANYQNFGAHFSQSATSDFQDPTDFGSFDLYDTTYTQQGTAMGDYSMPVARRPQAEILSHHVSAPAVPRARRQSINSMAASSITRPMSVAMSSYADSSYFTSSGAISPIMPTSHNYYPGQETFSAAASDDLFEYAGLEESVAASSLNDASDEDTSSSSPSAVVAEYNSETTPRSHSLYHVLPAEDGYYHCPYAATENCGHEPKQLKCEYDKHIDSHLKPFKCRNNNCRDLQFSSTACLLRHEREAHEMHGHAESLCEYPPCSRSVPGNGFRRSYNCKDHMTRCHGWVDIGPMDNKKRRTHSVGGKVNGVSKPKNKAPSRKQQIVKLRQEYFDRKAAMEDLVAGLDPEGPLNSMRIAQIQADLQTLGAINEALAKLERRPGSG